MNHRERVLTALDHKEPDRVPLSLGGTASSYTDESYHRLKAYLGIEGDIRPYRYGHTGNYLDERIFDALDTDYRYLVLSYPDDSHLKWQSENTFIDDWGILRKSVDGYVSRIGHPLAGAGLEDLERHPWPDYTRIYPAGLKKELGERAAYLREKTDFAVVARAALSGTFLEYGAWLCGFEEIPHSAHRRSRLSRNGSSRSCWRSSLMYMRSCWVRRGLTWISWRPPRITVPRPL